MAYVIVKESNKQMTPYPFIHSHKIECHSCFNTIQGTYSECDRWVIMGIDNSSINHTWRIASHPSPPMLSLLTKWFFLPSSLTSHKKPSSIIINIVYTHIGILNSRIAKTNLSTFNKKKLGFIWKPCSRAPTYLLFTTRLTTICFTGYELRSRLNDPNWGLVAICYRDSDDPTIKMLHKW